MTQEEAANKDKIDALLTFALASAENAKTDVEIALNIRSFQIDGVTRGYLETCIECLKQLRGRLEL